MRAWRKIFTSGQRLHPNCSKLQDCCGSGRGSERQRAGRKEGKREEEGQGNRRGNGEKCQDRVRRRLGTEEGKERNRLSYLGGGRDGEERTVGNGSTTSRTEDGRESDRQSNLGQLEETSKFF